MMNRDICRVLRRCGVPPEVLGYRYIAYAIELINTNDEYLWRITKMLYPAVAEKFNTTWSRVERNMRHAIEHAFNSMPAAVLEEVFGNTVDATTGKVTVSRFLAAVSEYTQYQI